MTLGKLPEDLRTVEFKELKLRDIEFVDRTSDIKVSKNKKQKE